VRLRAQVLIHGMQVQEQRLKNVSSELSQARNALASRRKELRNITSELAVFEERASAVGLSSAARAKLDEGVGRMKAVHAEWEEDERMLRSNEADLAAQVASEEARWTSLNEALDEIERSLK
jgi:hypothetical protein